MPIFGAPDRARQPKIVFAVFLIVAGVLLFLANLGLFPVRRVWEFWPLIFVAVGLSRLSNLRRPGSWVIGILFIVLGIIATLFNVGVFRDRSHDGSWPLSLLFIALGAAALIKTLGAGSTAGNDFNANAQQVQSPPWPTQENWQRWSKAGADSSPVLDNFTLMGSVNRRVESLDFKGGTLNAILGNIELDLRRSQFPEGKNQVVIEANAILGAIKLRIPETWRVVWNGVNVLGNFEDKTIPPITGSAAPQLIMTGALVLGEIVVEN